MQPPAVRYEYADTVFWLAEATGDGGARRTAA